MVWRRVSWRMGFAALVVLTWSVLIAGVAAGQSGGALIVTTDTTLDSDFTGTVFIESDDVVFDCAGHTLHGNYDGAGWPITVTIEGRSGVSVVNCVFDGSYQSGVRVANSMLVTIKDSIVHGSQSGVFDGISVSGSSQVTIVGNEVTHFALRPGPCHGPCGYAHGVHVVDSADVEIRGNTSSGNGRGFGILRSVGVEVVGNVANDNLGVGFRDSDASVNTYTANTCHNNFGGGSSPAGLCDWGVWDRVGFFDPSRALWHVPDGDGTLRAFGYGNPRDVPLVGAWGYQDCRFHPKPGLYRPSNGSVYLRLGNAPDAGSVRYSVGDPGDVPLVGDFDRNGCDTVSLYRPSTQQFFIFNGVATDGDALTEPDLVFEFGNPGDIPVVGDWDGDGIDEIGLYRPATGEFYWRNTLDTGIADGKIYYGDPADRFIAGDWGTTDYIDTPGVFRPSNTTVYLRHTLTQGPADSQYSTGQPHWLPITVTSGLADNATTP